jgi:hypothetical protein
MLVGDRCASLGVPGDNREIAAEQNPGNTAIDNPIGDLRILALR